MKVLWILASLGLVSPEIPSPSDDLFAAMAALKFPMGYQGYFSRYAVVDRPDGRVRVAYASPEIMAAVQSNQPFPIGGLLVIETYAAKQKNGSYLKDSNKHYIPETLIETIDIMQRRANNPGAIDNWNVGAFDPYTAQHDMNVNLSDCWVCHSSGRKREMVFTFPALKAFARSDKVQRMDCAKIERQLCDFHIDKP